MRRTDAPGQEADEATGFWLAGQITKPGALWDLIGLVGQGNWDGELVVVDEEHQRSIFFERGTVVGAQSSADRERIGEVLYRYGALNEAQIDIVAAAVSPKVRFGEAAVGLGFLSQDKLFQFIGKQTEEIVYAVMLVAVGAFYFLEHFDPSRLPNRLNLTVQSLLMEGARRMDEMSCFRARIPSDFHVPAHVPGTGLDEDHEHWDVYMAVDGNRSVEELGRAIGQGEFETTRTLFQLVQSGVVVVRPPRPTGPEAIVGLFNLAIATILGEADDCGGGQEIREQLASFATASGVYDALFRDAGPAPDGTLDAPKIAETVDVLIGPDGELPMLAQWLYEYAAFAMFIAEPLLRSCEQSDAVAITRKVAELLKPLAPEG